MQWGAVYIFFDLELHCLHTVKCIVLKWEEGGGGGLQLRRICLFSYYKNYLFFAKMETENIDQYR